MPAARRQLHSWLALKYSCIGLHARLKPPTVPAIHDTEAGD
jgi:hypothetical protein